MKERRKIMLRSGIRGLRLLLIAVVIAVIAFVFSGCELFGDRYDEGYDAGYEAGLNAGKEEGYNDGYEDGHNYGYDEGYEDGQKNPPVISDGELEVHFLELGNKYAGDSIYIKYGDIDIVIDAGSRSSSASTITGYIDNHIEDNKLEYVIATHGHQDHIAGFFSTGSGNNKVMGVLDKYEVGTIIDFPKTGLSSATLKNYRDTVTAAVANGAKHYTALECYNEENGAQRVYDFGGGVEMEILYNYYYENSTSNENNYSVCLIIRNGEEQYLFTGDLEKGGEDRLVDYYEENHNGIGHCALFKAGHHGSSTSSNEKILEEITPDYVCICTCADSPEYSDEPLNQFPTQEFIERIAPYTDNVYVTTLSVDYSAGIFEPFNGNIVFKITDGLPVLSFSGSDKKLKDSDWFKENRIMPDAWITVSP